MSKGKVFLNRIFLAFLAVTLFTVITTGNVAQVAAISTQVGPVSPAKNLSDASANHPTTNLNWHSLILSDHGRVEAVDVGMYFNKSSDGSPNPGDKSFKIQVTNNNRYCQMTELDNPPYDRSNTFLVLEIGDQDSPDNPPVRQKYNIPGNRACNGWLDGRTFNIPANHLKPNFGKSGLWGARVQMRWVSNSEAGIDNLRNKLANEPMTNDPDSRTGSQIWFRFDAGASGGIVGYVDTNNSSEGNPNNSFIWRDNGINPDGDQANEYATVHFPFGLDCSYKTEGKRNVPIIVYDADNGTSSQQTPLRFSVREVHSGRLPAKDYSKTPNGNGAPAANVDDVYVKESPGSSREGIPSALRTPAGGGANDHPQFVPSGWDNRGGSTEVRMLEIKARTKYILEIKNIHMGQFIYFGVPGDAIFGSPDYDYEANCPTSSSISPDVGLTANSFEPGGQVTASASVTNTADSAVTSDYRRVFWYENSSPSDDIYNGGDSLASTQGENNITVNKSYAADGTTDSPGWVDTIPATAKRVCTQLTLANATPGIGIEDNPTPSLCENIIRRPYFNVTHGDVNAAAALRQADGTCATGSTSRISAFNLGDSGYQGSATQIAAFSAGLITQFVSGNAPKGLTFANTGSGSPSSQYGGGFAQTYCIPDYWASTAGNPRNKMAGCSGNDVYAEGHINVNVNCRNVSSVGVGDVPNLRRVVADGNIYISRDVTELDGIYIAKGNIYTCGVSNGYSAINVEANEARFNTCSNPLLIRGALVAGGTIKLQRTTGSLLLGPAAETFEYNPFVWLSAINPPSGGGASTNKFDYITAMPPVL